MTYRNIVVGTDGSATAGEAVEHAALIASNADARLVIVTAYSPDPDEQRRRQSDAPDDIKWMLTDRNQAEATARDARHAAERRGATRIAVQAVPGDPSNALIETADEFNADLLVVGSVGLTSAARFLLGSVANTVLHHAPCDVLVVQTD